MGSPGGEPRVLLNALKPMLGVVGDIKTPQEVLRVIGMMKDAEKLMSRCVYLNILKATCKQARNNEEKKLTLERFLTTGGWGILNKWLHEFTRSQNYPVLLELIDVLKIMPVTVELLKQGNTGKLMKQMTKLENVEVKKSALQLIKQWKGMIRSGNTEIQDATNKRTRDQEAKANGEKPEKRAKLASADKGVSDSSGFMMALTASTPVPSKKKKRTNSKDTKTTLPLDEIFKANDDKKKLESEVDRSLTENPGSPEVAAENDDLDSSLNASPAVEAANRAFKQSRDSGFIVDEGSLARKKNKKKRNITWATDEKLVQVSYFELLPGERKGHHAENFSLARQHELLLEKQTLKSRRGEDKMVELVQWSHLIPVDNAGVPNFVPGEKSREKYLQGEREKNVLAFIFLTRESLPNSPAEPDFDADEHSARAQPRMIPHDEEGTIFPSKLTNVQIPPNTVSEDERIPSPVTTKANNVLQVGNNNKGNYKDDLSPAVQNIMATLLQKNMPNNQSGNTNAPSPNKVNNANKNPNANFTCSASTEGIPSILDSNIPNPRARNVHSGPRFPATGRGESGPPARGRGGFNGMNGPRQRWEGPPPGMQNQNQPPPQEDWNNYENNYEGNNYYNEGYENYNDNYRGGGGNKNSRSGGQSHFRNDGYGGGRGFHRGGGGGNRGRGGGGGGGGNWGKNPNAPPNRGNLRGGSGNSSRGKTICQHFGTSRGCRNGDRCNFLHVRR